MYVVVFVYCHIENRRRHLSISPQRQMCIIESFCVSDAQKAAQIITTTFSSKDIRLADANNLYLYNTTLPVAKINRSFIEAGIDIQDAHLCEDTLEDYFKKITGGEGIA